MRRGGGPHASLRRDCLLRVSTRIKNWKDTGTQLPKKTREQRWACVFALLRVNHGGCGV